MNGTKFPPGKPDRSDVRIRFAPNGEIAFPGFIVRTVLYAWLFARRSNGTFVLRLDDTDIDRQQPGALQSYPDGLRWLGLDWDEGPEVGGRYGPYRQSQRLEFYRDAVDRLLDGGYAYRCYCPPERLATVARAARLPGATHSAYDGHCRDVSIADVETSRRAGREPCIRFRTPDSGEIVSHDLLRGAVRVPAQQLSDFVICRPDGWATYHLTVVTDDAAMRISHVIRGVEGLANMAPQALLHSALGLDQPLYLHHPLVRTLGLPIGDQFLPRGHLVFLDELRESGIPPEAVLAYYGGIAYGGAAGISTLEEQVADFDYRRISRKDFVDQSLPALIRTAEKYLRSPAARALVEVEAARALVSSGLDRPSAMALAKRAAPVLQQRIRRIDEIGPLLRFVTNAPAAQQLEAPAAKWLHAAAEAVSLRRELRHITRVLSASDNIDLGEINRRLLDLLGAPATTLSLDECIAILGRKETLARWEVHVR